MHQRYRKKEQKIYDEIMSSIANLGKDKDKNIAFQSLLNEILNK